MGRASITVTVHKSTEPTSQLASAQHHDEPTMTCSDDGCLPESAFPSNKAELLSLFDVKPLPINNKIAAADLAVVNQQRLTLYESQHNRTRHLFTLPAPLRPTYPVISLKPRFLEYQNYLSTRNLDQRGVVDFADVECMWKQIHIVDDLLADILRMMPAQRPVGWQVTSAGKNHLKLPTVGRLKDTEQIADQGSLNSYVLGHFGVMSYTFDRAFFIGHVIGYLFCCYYLSHLSIPYGVTPLAKTALKGFSFATLETDKLVRLLQTLDVHCKRRVYQLAIVCARLSQFKMEKYVEKLLIKEVNEFDKKQQIKHLDTLIRTGLMPDVDFVDLDDEDEDAP